MRRLLVATLVSVACVPSARSRDTSCGEGSVVVAGACVSYRVASAFCGAASSPRSGACVRKTCAPGEALEIEHGLCLPESSVLASIDHGPKRDDDPKRRATCLYGALTSARGQLNCMMGPLSCWRGEHYLKKTNDAGQPLELAGSCEPVPSCGIGELFDEQAGKCQAVVRAGLVDVGSWARLALGVDGAEGTNAFCAPVRALGPRARFQIELSVPDNDITRAHAKLVARAGTLPASSDAAERAMEPLTETLRDYGGTAVAAAVSLEITCTPGATATPTLEVVSTSNPLR